MTFLLQFFANPLFLAGLAAAAVPLVLHLMHRRKALEIPFPSLRYLRLSQNRTARRKRLEEWLLLLLRMAALACLALALANPFWGGAGLGRDGEPRAVAVVIDTSYSMALSEGPAGQKHARLEGAQRVAAQALEGLVNEQSQACLIPTSLQWEVPLGTAAQEALPAMHDSAATWANMESLSGRIDRVRDFVWQTRASGAPANLKAAVEKALQQLDASPIRHKELYILTDLQRVEWEPALQSLEKHAQSGIQTAVIDVRDPHIENRDDQNNLAVEQLTLTSRQKRIGSPVVVAVRLRNYAAQEVRTRVAWDWGRLPGSAPVAGQPAADPQIGEYQAVVWLAQNHAEKDVTIPANATAEITFETVFKEQGSYVGRLSAGTDALPIDNTRMAVYRVSEQIPVAVVQSPREHVFYQSGAFYLQSALDPFGSSDSKGRRSTFAVRLLKPQELATADLSAYASVILAGVDEVSPEAVKRLTVYLENGGGVVVFPAEGGDFDTFTRQMGVREETDLGPSAGLLPGRFAERFGDPTLETTGESVRIQEHDHPALAAFRGRFADLLAAVVVRAGLDLRIADSSAARTLLATASGRPILASVRVGRGEVVQWATSCDGRWGNLAITNFFPVALHDMVLAMSNANADSISQIIGPMAAHGADIPPGPVTILTPDGQKLAGTHTLQKPAAWPAVLPGFYAVVAAGGREVYAANIDAAQSDLSGVKPETVATAFAWSAGGRGVRMGQGSQPAEAAQCISSMRQGYQASRDLLLAALMLFLIESVLTGRFFQSTGSTPASASSPVPTAPATSSNPPAIPHGLA